MRYDIKTISLLNDKCYICGRSKKDLEMVAEAHLLEKELSDKEAESENAKDILKSTSLSRVSHYKEYFAQLLKETQYNENLKFGVKTVETDLKTFKELIPRLSDLLDYKEGGPEEKLSDIHARLTSFLTRLENDQGLEVLEEIEDSEIDSVISTITRIEKEIDELIEKQEELQKPLHHIFGLEKAEIYFAFTSDGVPVDISYHFNGKEISFYSRSHFDKVYRILYQICQICNRNFNLASKAAFDIIHQYDDD